MLIDIIKNDFLEARKTKNQIKSNLLSVIISEIETKSKEKNSKEISDEDIIKIIKSIKKKLDETNGILKVTDEKTVKEISIISEYLPTELTKEEIETWLNSNFNLDNRNKPAIMKAAKQQFGQSIDMKYLASLI